MKAQRSVAYCLFGMGVLGALVSCIGRGGTFEEGQPTVGGVSPVSPSMEVASTRIAAPSASPVEAEVGSPGGTVVEAKSADAQSFHIYLTTDATSRDYQFKVYASGLWQRDPETNLPVPYMAESWSLSEDGLTYTFHLRKDMKWSDNYPITASDFVWTYEQASDPDSKYPYVSILDDIESYRAVDDFTLAIKLKSPSCTGILTAGQITPLPKHTWQDLPWGDPVQNPEILNPTVVSGPWKLGEWRRDEYALFEPNPTYFGEVPKLASYVVRIVPEASVQFQMLLSGEVDFAVPSAVDYDQALKSEDLELYTWDPAQPTWYYLGFNFTTPLLGDVAFRHALAYAMPRQEIADQVFKGRAKPTYSTYSPPSWVFDSNVPRYDYDLETAKSILEESGYRLDPKGVRLDKQGAPIKLRIFYPTNDAQRELIAAIAEAEFKKLGIASEIRGLESKALFEYLQDKPSEWDMWVGLARDTSDPHFMYQAWSRSTIPAINTGGYINEDVEKLFRMGNTPPCDEDRRRAIYQQIQLAVSADSPYIFLVYNTAYAFVNRRVIVNSPTALGINYDLSEWSVTE